MSAATQRNTGRGAAAIELVSTLYPPPLVVSTGRTSRAEERAAWSAVPSVDRPRLLVPGSGPAAAQVVRRQLTGQRPRTRVARAVLGLAAGTGLLARMPRLRIAVSGPAFAPSIEDPLREVLGVDDLCLALPIGPARANRKPVIQVTDRFGEVLAFVKVGHHDLTRRLVRSEAASLELLAGTETAGLRAPKPLAILSWSGYDVLVLEPLRIPAHRLTGDAHRERLQRLALDIARLGATSRRAWREQPYRDELESRLARCGPAASAVRSELDRVDASVLVEVGAWHGDLNSGNVAVVSGVCPVWDWERFEQGVPVGFDLLHHDLHEAITVRGARPRDAATRLVSDAASLLGPIGVDPAAARVVARTYLVTLAGRYLVDDQAEAGAELGRVHEWLLPALEGEGA